MKKIVTIVLSSIVFIACVQSQSAKIPLPEKKAPSANEQVAYFGEGCFWHAEIVFQSLKGVRDAVSGYAGGSVKNPDYETVCGGSTGHAETVQVFYDPAQISYATLVSAFFASMDPTTLNRQGNDEGTQYRSVAFYKTDAERKILEDEIKKRQQQYKQKIVTQVAPFSNFYKAEDYHQEYIHYHPNTGYVAGVSVPEFLEFRKTFKGAAFNY